MEKAGDSFKPASLAAVVAALRNAGCQQAFCKPLRANDNSKQQIYFGTDFTKLPPFPTGEMMNAVGTSRKPGGVGKAILRATPQFSWLNSHGTPQPAPHAKIIFYPQYPEVRFSGFLLGCNAAPSEWMTQQTRIEGRLLVIGVTGERELIGCLLIPGTQAARELGVLLAKKREEDLFLELSLDSPDLVDSRAAILRKLWEVHAKGWIAAQRLGKDGKVMPYGSQNSGGYTLEAECGIIPNGKSEPDYLGWEIKQYKVNRCDRILIASARITLMTPEPDRGFYGERGLQAFVRKFGYKNPKKADRFDFTGTHKAGVLHPKTKLVMEVHGYDAAKKKIVDVAGGIRLTTADGKTEAADWSFAKLLTHWQRKHNHAAYVPSRTQTDPKAHQYCPVVRLAEGTTFSKYLDAVLAGRVFYDPGMKIESESLNPKGKPRSQFRITANNVHHLYDRVEDVELRP